MATTRPRARRALNRPTAIVSFRETAPAPPFTVIYDLLALLAATCWAFGSVLSVAPSRHLGAFAYSRWRMSLISLGLWLVAWLIHAELGVTGGQLILLALSGFIGIFVGDTAYFSAMNRLGPRRTGVLFATNAIFTALAGMLFMNDSASPRLLAGMVLTMVGVYVAILYGRREDNPHAWERDHGNVLVGIALGLVAALCQSAGTLLVKPVMADGVSPATAAAIRTSVAALMHLLLFAAGLRLAQARQPANLRVLAQTLFSGLIGMALGMTLLLWALSGGEVGTVSVLSSVTPVLLLFLLWAIYRAAPPPGAWLGAIAAIAGTALIVTR